MASHNGRGAEKEEGEAEEEELSIMELRGRLSSDEMDVKVPARFRLPGDRTQMHFLLQEQASQAYKRRKRHMRGAEETQSWAAQSLQASDVVEKARVAFFWGA
jgi:hypothetical protein